MERVLARLQDILLPERTAGQSNALEQIARNIERYVETQSMAAPLADAGRESVPAQSIDTVG